MPAPPRLPDSVFSYMVCPLASSRPLVSLVRKSRKPLFPSNAQILPFSASWTSLLHRKISLHCSCSPLCLVEFFKPCHSLSLSPCASRGPLLTPFLQSGGWQYHTRRCYPLQTSILVTTGDRVSVVHTLKRLDWENHAFVNPGRPLSVRQRSLDGGEVLSGERRRGRAILLAI